MQIKIIFIKIKIILTCVCNLNKKRITYSSWNFLSKFNKKIELNLITVSSILKKNTFTN